MDGKLIVMLMWLQLQQLATDVTCIQLTDLYTSQLQLQQHVGLQSQQPSAASEMMYQRKAEQLLNDENCFKLVLVC